MNTTTVLVKDRVAIYAVDAARMRTERARSDTRDTVNVYCQTPPEPNQ